jgi:hypothetical protein
MVIAILRTVRSIMKYAGSALLSGLFIAWLSIFAHTAAEQAEVPSFQAPAKPMTPGEPPGERPYEMVKAGREPAHPPLVNFDSLDGWKVLGFEGATGELSVSQRERLWDSPVARLVYKGTSKNSAITIVPPAPIAVPEAASAVTIWIYGNNWSWTPDPKTPQVEASLLIRDRAGATHSLKLDVVRWREWWLVHRLIPPQLRELKPLSFAGLKIAGCGNTEDRELYFEDLAFFDEHPRPLTFETRPKRGIDPFPGQDQGANTGPGRLPFPTRAETILPDNYVDEFTTQSLRTGDRYILQYRGEDGTLQYTFSPAKPFFRDIEVRLNGTLISTAWTGAGPDFGEEVLGTETINFAEREGAIEGEWRVKLRGREARVAMAARLWQKSLVIDTICRDGIARELSYGTLQGVAKPELILLPYINYGQHHLNVLMSRGKVPFFAGIWMDWYRSNASQPYAVDTINGSEVRLNGGVRYIPRTDGKLNAMFERTFITFSPRFEETLPSIPNPPATRGREAGARLWQETWGPENYKVEMERSKKLRAYGIEMLTQLNHEITWRDSGESFTFRTMAAPGKGGDEALRDYVAAQRSLGWRSGLYTNYTDYSPVNAFWDPDMVMLDPQGEMIRAWPRCYAPKALFAVEMDRKLAPVIAKKYGTNAAYTDVHTSVSPWDRCDYDARVPGAGTFAATFYAFGELLLHDQEVYDGHCWSEGNHQWLYAGLTTGNYGLTYSDLKLWQYPYLPHFDLLKMHPLSVDIGVPWTAQFFHGKEGWDKPDNIERSIDQFIAATIAYGHMGWLVEEQHGIRQTCRSYYMLQQLQSRYALERPVDIRYGRGDSLISSSAAFLDGSWKSGRLYVKYGNGLEVWVNGDESGAWTVVRKKEKYVLPSFGWLATQGDDFFSGSILVDGRRADRVSSPHYVFLDGRGTFGTFEGIGTSGSVAVRVRPDHDGVSIIAVDGVGRLLISPTETPLGPGDARGAISWIARAEALSVNAYDVNGKQVGLQNLVRPPGISQPGWELMIMPKAVRYEVQKVR